MKATDILMDEHRVIERVIAALETAVSRIEDGNPPPPRFFLDAVDFIAGFADGCHHHKEEDVLFQEMAACGMPVGSGPIAVMLTEHEQGRGFARTIRTAAERAEGGDAAAWPQITAAARGYVALLRAHIAKEDEVLFPMAAQVIPRARHDQVLARFQQVEHEDTGTGAHERYLALAAKLEREMAQS